MSNEGMILFYNSKKAPVVKNLTPGAFPSLYIFTADFEDIVGTNFVSLNAIPAPDCLYYVGETQNGGFIGIMIHCNILSISKSDRLYEIDYTFKPIAVFKDKVNINQVSQALHWKLPSDFIEW